MRITWIPFGTIILLALGHGFAQTSTSATSFSLDDASALTTTPNVKAEPVVYQGRKAVKLTTGGEDAGGLATLAKTDFEDGTIEADIALKPTTPPGVRNPGFVGIAFRARTDLSHYELFYLRPGNGIAEDQAMRNHAAQYVSEPAHGWYRLRREWPWVYESHVDIEPEKWTKVRIEVAGRKAKLFVNGSAAIMVDGLKGEDLHGVVALWSYTNEECYFANVRVTPAVPQPIKNGSDAAGTWSVRYASDAGLLEGMLTLTRDGSKLTGTWSGALGENCAVSGTWRNGYVELTFPGEWPKESGQGAPGPVTASLAGWIDGDSAKGRMRVEEHSDGQWMAIRKP
jgi:hypothetical protein